MTGTAVSTRTVLFISKATPGDDEFVLWLAPRLEGAGYEVFADILSLEGGMRGRKEITGTLQNRAVKMLLCGRNATLERNGVQEEIGIAEDLAKELPDPKFIIPLRLERYKKIFGIGELQYVNFERGWAEGLAKLLDTLKRQKVPRALKPAINPHWETFVPTGSAYARLWQVLDIGPPKLGNCTRTCRDLASKRQPAETDAVLMDLYRYMEQLLAESDRSVSNRLANLPVACRGQWVSERPIYLVDDKEVRTQLGNVLQHVHFWSPPCEVRDLPDLTRALGIERLSPRLKVVANREAGQDQGEVIRNRFQAAVEHLSAGLARNEPQTREQLRITWDELRDIPLFVYPEPFAVAASEPVLSGRSLRIKLNALLSESPRELHVWEDALQMRESGGRAIASLFPFSVQRGLQAEWVASWIDSMERPVEHMRFAADEEQKEKLVDAAQELAETIQTSPTSKIAVTPPASRTSSVKPRRLKEFQSGVTAVTVHIGTPTIATQNTPARPLVSQPPATVFWSSGTSRPAPVEYSTIDLEQRGWEILVHALNTSDGPELRDFRQRRGVGADGAIDWKKFVELKASGRAMPASVQLTNTEYERAMERGCDFILALVYGLEEGERTEARLIFDPARNLTIKPVNGVRLVGLSEATAVILTFGEALPTPATE